MIQKAKSRLKRPAGYDEYVDTIPKEHRVQVAAATKLAKATKGKVKVEFTPQSFIEGDEEASAGHQYTAVLKCPARGNDLEWPEVLYLDDRGPESLSEQLAKELRGVASFYERIAKDLDRERGAK